MRTGICICGCRWDQHHLGLVVKQAYVDETGEAYIPQECERWGFNEGGGMKYDVVKGSWEDHCHGYRDTGWREEDW